MNVVKETIDQSLEHKMEPPRPLRKASIAQNPYPVESLGPKLSKAVKAIHEKIQAPEAICAQAVLAAASLAVQGYRDVELPTGQRKPLSIFFLSIASSGERKTSADSEATKPIKEYEAFLQEKHKKEYGYWKNKNEAYEKQRNNITNDKKYKDVESREKALNDLGDAPLKPLTPMLLCSEPTFEGLCKLLFNGQPGLGIFTSEGGEFIGGYSLGKDQKLKTASAISQVWDGEPIKRVRSGEGTTIMPGRRLSMHLMVQPGVARTMLSDTVFNDQGLLSRFLVTAPATMAGSRFSRELSPAIAQALSEYTRHIRGILEQPLPLKEGTQNELNPECIMLTAAAKKVYWEFVDEIERLIGPNGALEPIKAFANKLPEHAVRLACVIALVENITTHSITDDELAFGISLAKYYAKESLRLAGDFQVDPDILLAEKLLHWMHNFWDSNTISLPDIYQRSLNAIYNKGIANKIVHILADHGWLEKIPEGGQVNRVRRKDVWKIVRDENGSIS